MSIYLYIKTHNKTGLKYLGKTSRKDPHAYTGSGKYWLRHLDKHGYDYSTEIIFSCSCPQQFKKTALEYSKKYNIVESKEWANLVNEQGDGGDTSSSPVYKDSIAKRDITGNKNGMFGKSAVAENNLKWYTDGKNNLYLTEGTEPCGYVRGRSNLKRPPHTLETRKKISESTKGQLASNRLSVISPSGKVYPSIKKAALSLGMTVSQFRHRCVKNGDWILSKATPVCP